jgi:hypothetical protein
MFEIMFKLLMGFCLLGVSLSGFVFAMSMWRKSVNQCKCICEECKCCN